eukprot:m.242672 g.242672  ORF g.242672 m.242672 type:complete len:446 (+) comp19010_c1_seq1:242-1579(+)
MAAFDPRRMRRVIAEDPEWNVPSVPSLVELCLRFVTATFEETPLLDKLPPEYHKRIVDELSVTLPLSLTAPLIQDQDFWKRSCQARWKDCQVGQRGGDWRRYFFEKYLEQKLEQFVPGVSDEEELLRAAKVASPFVQTLELEQLLPPPEAEPQPAEPAEPLPLDGDGAVPEADEEEDEGEDEEGDGPKSNEHQDLGPVLELLPNLRELTVSYRVKECGMDFKWTMFGMTKTDCANLAAAVKTHGKLEKLALPQCQLDDSKCRLLVAKLLDNAALKTLDLSHNMIGDRGARGLGKLLHKHSALVHLNLSDNQVAAVGARALGMSLKDNTTLQSLNLCQNQLADKGGQALFKGLLGNVCLQALHLSANDLATSTCVVLAQFLEQPSALQHLDISANELGEEAGKIILEGLRNNSTLLTMDMRLAQLGKDTEVEIHEHMKQVLSSATA